MKKIGTISKESGAEPTDDDLRVADFLIGKGMNILFLKANRTKGSHTPDAKIDDNLKWEFKTPRKNGKYTIEHAYRAALNQSVNVVFDIRNIKASLQNKTIYEITRRFNDFKKAEKLMIITREQKLLDFHK